VSVRKWTVPHKEAVADLGPIRFGEQMPPDYRIWRAAVLAGVLFIGGGMWLAAENAYAPPPKPGMDTRAALKMQRRTESTFIGGVALVVIGAVCVVVCAVEFWWLSLVGSYSLHEKGAMSIIWGKEARIYYDDVDVLTFRARRRTLDGKLIDDALWVTFESKKLGTPPVRLFRGRDPREAEAAGLDIGPPEVIRVCNEVAARIAGRILSALARGGSYAFTDTVRLSPDGVVLGGWFRDKTLRWEEIAQLEVVAGHCYLYKWGKKKPVAHWLYQTPNCIPVHMVLNHAMRAKIGGATRR
jgi:hypothetical protein